MLYQHKNHKDFILINQLSDMVKAYIQSSSLVILVLNVSDILFPLSF